VFGNAGQPAFLKNSKIIFFIFWIVWYADLKNDF
jgi:hypothetical protein